MRIISVAKGNRLLAAPLGFFEVLIWLLGISQIMQNLTNPLYYIAYAAGFAGGNITGIYLEEKLAVGKLVLRIITSKDAEGLIHRLTSQGFGVTCVNAKGKRGEAKLLYLVIRRRDLHGALSIVERLVPEAFYSIEDVRSTSNGIFPAVRPGRIRRNFSIPLPQTPRPRRIGVE